MVHVNIYLQTSYDSSLLLTQNWKSICSRVPFALYFHLCCEIKFFSHLSFSFDLQKFSDDEWANMSIYNLAKTMHNISLQFSGKCNTYLYTMMCNDYVHVFKQSTLYRKYLKGGPLGHGHDKNELFFRGACGSNDLTKLTIVVANYMFEPSFANHLPHLEGKQVFGFVKQPVDCPLSIENDSHHLDFVNLSCP